MQHTGSEGKALQLMPKVQRMRLHDTLVGHLRRFIVEGVLEAGKKLKERELCETLAISRTPLREALNRLRKYRPTLLSHELDQNFQRGISSG